MIGVNFDESGMAARMSAVLDHARFKEPVLKAGGREAANRLRKHFLELDRTDANTIAPDRRSHMWRDIAHATGDAVIEDRGFSITIADPRIAQKVFGGEIEAKRVENLAIPESDKAYDRAPAK